MAKNDLHLLDGIIDDRIVKRLPSEKRDEAFEYLAFEQVMKDFDLSMDELLSGAIDGSRDGGIDAFFIVINGHLLQDPESFIWPRTGSELHVIIITSKHHDTFKQATLDALIATLTEILNFAINESQLTGAYSQPLLRMRSNLMYAYRKLSPRLSSFSASVYYTSRGDTSKIGEEVSSRATQINALIKDYFGSCKSQFAFLGATELVELHRKIPSYKLELPFVEALSKGERYVVLARLSDYYTFISEGGRLRRYLFESNVRDFMGLNPVNEDIKSTLENPASPDFWWLNNGITILASSANITGKSITATDTQIVNGLQTTESIFRHFQGGNSFSDDRCVLVKVIVSHDAAVRDAIIRATNNQTNVELASLHATDKIQRDIEDVLLMHGLFYERRKNHYANQGRTPAELVTPLYAAAGYVALVMKHPHKAASLRSKFMRSPESYEAVFSDKAPLEVWPKIVHILKRVDVELEALRPRAKGADRFLKGWRYITALLLVSESFGKYTFSAHDLATYDIALITPAAVESIWLELSHLSSSNTRKGAWTSPATILEACGQFAVKRGITGAIALPSNRSLRSTSQPQQVLRNPITDDFIEKVKAVLPQQPWKPGLRRKIKVQLKCNTSDLLAAFERLIEDGVFMRQKDGVLYDADGNVVSFDIERVDPDTLELRPDQV
ncbi:MAG: AIPR family protein [Nitrospirota bacterium]